MRKILILLTFLPLTLLAQETTDYQQMDLEKLNEFLFTEYVLNKNTQPLQEIATDDFMLIAAPGMIESKQQAIDGVGNLNISAVKLTTDKVTMEENIGIVVGFLEMTGAIMNRPVPEKIRYSSTFVKQNGKWRLMMRTMTPMRK